MNYVATPVAEVAAALGTSPAGLDADTARQRLVEQGPNQITDAKRKTAWLILLHQFTDVMMLILLAAAIVSGVVGDWKSTYVVLAIVVLNALIGFFQEYRAEQAMKALKKLAANRAQVFRNGPEKTPLQAQISRFVVRMAWIGVGAFALVFGINYARSGDWSTALLFGLTLAMSILPEEISVAFSSFMALGAARLSRMGVLTKPPQTVESLGSATVICTDKTGTITQEGMSVRVLYDGAAQVRVNWPDTLSDTATTVLTYARWASETDPFDAMEKAITVAYEAACPSKRIDTYPMV